MMDRSAKSFPYEKRLDRFRILKLEKKALNEGGYDRN